MRAPRSWPALRLVARLVARTRTSGLAFTGVVRAYAHMRALRRYGFDPRQAPLDMRGTHLSPAEFHKALEWDNTICTSTQRERERDDSKAQPMPWLYLSTATTTPHRAVQCGASTNAGSCAAALRLAAMLGAAAKGQRAVSLF